MQKTKNLTTREAIKYAEENGYNTTKFVCRKDGKLAFVGKFVDAYYEFIQIPVLGSGFCRISDVEKELGYNLSFDILDDDEYKGCLAADFLLRGMRPPTEE